ncbi:MAG: phosphatidate cytidylyltransferase [Flavobacteriales bacterium]|nr:phosphatidate cytidylyltransferase [Flavobacteriales bacterium]
MNETLKRALSGVVYVAIMWLGTSYSEATFSLLFAVLGVISIYEMWKLRKGKTKVLAFLYVLIPFFIIQLFGITDHDYPNSPFDPSHILFMFVLTWTFDTFAYLFGVRFGKTKIMPSVSPKKSWEGFVGGFIFTIISAYLTVSYFPSIELNHAIVISLFLPFTATLGDFIESHYKRQAGVKDSGNFIPGHGGMLDRMDAFMITIPVLYIYLHII